MNLTVRGIGRLLTMTEPALPDAAVVVREGRVAWTGPAAKLPPDAPEQVLDVEGACVVPGFVDAHTHLVFAGVRRDEFVARLAGQPYDGGGIRTTVAATRAASVEDLAALALGRAATALSNGTTTMEIKSGYGLTPDDELRLLDVIAMVGARSPLRIEATYLGAHVVPEGRDRESYVAEVIETLPAAAARGARWCDVFCDRGVFTVDEAHRILSAARDHGLGLRLHAEEIARTGAAALAAELGCASADHLEHVSAEDARAMAAAGVVGVLLPTVTLSLRSQAWGHAAILRDAGVQLALATDCNPGTSWCESMPYAVQLACLAMGLSVDEAFRAATLGAAHSLRLDDVGHLGQGARGDLAVLTAEHEADVVAHLGGRPVLRTIVGGELVN
ncbi:MAG: imidazolonepropionase [Actinomycetota bacterium]|jgi:imidazolonepropionase|nr:imidazolonepropionase [Actinomycetota bacterium]